jgi:hypothetical protein
MNLLPKRLNSVEVPAVFALANYQAKHQTKCCSSLSDQLFLSADLGNLLQQQHQ